MLLWGLLFVVALVALPCLPPRGGGRRRNFDVAIGTCMQVSFFVRSSMPEKLFCKMPRYVMR